MLGNRFSVLLGQKRAREQRAIPLVEVAHETGITRKTLAEWANNKIQRFDADVIIALCKYFRIQPGELFDYKPED